MLSYLGHERLLGRLLQLVAEDVVHGEILGAPAARVVPAVGRLGALSPQLLRAVPAHGEVLQDDGGEEVERDDDGDEPPDDEVELRPLAAAEVGSVAAWY